MIPAPHKTRFSNYTINRIPLMHLRTVRTIMVLTLLLASFMPAFPKTHQDNRKALESALQKVSSVEPLLGVYDILVKYGLQYNVPVLCPIYDSYHISSRYGWRIHPVTGNRKFHAGIDMAAPLATFVHASADGVVSHSGRKGGYGNCIVLRHRYGFETVYGHLSLAYAKRGTIVHAGDVIGFVGSTGVSTGNHLHYEIRKGGKAVRPVILDERLSVSQRRDINILRSRTAERVTEESKKRHLK